MSLTDDLADPGVQGVVTPGVRHLTVAEREGRGHAARAVAPRDSHLGWRPASDRPDPIALLSEQDATREAELVPVRHGRMMVSPFTFYRGAAKIMAADLASVPRAGIQTQLCGDAHLSNFGLFASPERALILDLNDFDETLRGPFEYDVIRMATSFTIAARNNGLSAEQQRDITALSIRSYRKAMRRFAKMGNLEIWYARLTSQDLMDGVNKVVRATKGKENRRIAEQAGRRAERIAAKATSRDSLQALSKLAELVDGKYRIISQPPVIVPSRDLTHLFGVTQDRILELVHQQFRAYRATLRPDVRTLLERYEFVDMAHKVVGVGSVGTRAFIVLLQGRDMQDPLFLQVKEATRSVLEDHLPRSPYRECGERVVQGQRLMQAASDIFLGWTRGLREGRFTYWRQLRDMKQSIEVERMLPPGLGFFAEKCGWTLARAHARAGDPIAIASYLGRSDEFETSMTDFANRYADQNERDFEAFVAAVRSGRLEAVEGV